MSAAAGPKSRPQRFTASLQKDLPLYLLCLPALVLVTVFHYFPMWGAFIAFESYSPAKGILGSKWVGFLHFARFFRDPYFFRVVRNTLLLGIYSLAIGFPAPDHPRPVAERAAEQGLQEGHADDLVHASLSLHGYHRRHH